MNGQVTAFGLGPTFAGPTTLAASDTLDFAVGFAGAFNSDSTGLRATVTDLTTAVPEPGTMTLMGLGLAGLIGAGRRKKKLQQQSSEDV